MAGAEYQRQWRAKRPNYYRDLMRRRREATVQKAADWEEEDRKAREREEALRVPDLDTR